MTRYFQSQDPRNFAAEVSVTDFGVAFGLPSSDAQNPLYREPPARPLDPDKRVIVAVSYGTFEWQFSGDLAGNSAPGAVAYHVGAIALDAKDGTILAAQMPICK